MAYSLEHVGGLPEQPEHAAKVLGRLRELNLIDAGNKALPGGPELRVDELRSDPALAPSKMFTISHMGTLTEVEMTGYGDTLHEGRVVLSKGNSMTGIPFSRVIQIEKL